jgi:glycosyltransferase involved in cell wall biosynthesis
VGDVVPEVSVVISTYNRKDLLPAALGSALGQTAVDHEVIVVDNGSTDGTEQLLASWTDPRLRVVRNESSLGSVGGRNTGLAHAEGEWVGMLDDDDLWAPDKLRAQLDALEATGRDWAYTGCVHIDRAGEIIGGRPPLSPEAVMAELPTRFPLPGGMSNVIWRRDRLDGDGLLDPRLPFPADWDVSLRLSRQGPPACVARPLVAYRQHGGNMSRNAAHYRLELIMLEAKRADLACGRPIDWGAHYRFIASEELRVGARLAALRAYVRAIAAGDRDAIPRVAGVVLPTSVQRRLLRTRLSDAAWLQEAATWLPNVLNGQRIP